MVAGNLHICGDHYFFLSCTHPCRILSSSKVLSSSYVGICAYGNRGIVAEEGVLNPMRNLTITHKWNFSRPSLLMVFIKIQIAKQLVFLPGTKLYDALHILV